MFCPCPRHEHEPVANLAPGTIIEAGQRFLASRRELEVWRRRQLDTVHRERSLRTPLGRKRLFFGPVERMKREIFNFPIQSTAADLINRAFRGLHAQSAPVFLQWHDYLGVECLAGDAKLWGDNLTIAMQAPCPEMSDAVFPVEIKVERPLGTKAAV